MVGKGALFWENSNPDSWIQKRILLFFFLQKSKNESWIQRIHSPSDFFGSNLNSNFWYWWSERFLEKGFENSTSVKQSSMQIYLSRHIFSRSYVTKPLIVEKKIQVIIPFRKFVKFSPKVQTEALTSQDSFICVTFSIIHWLILMIVNANSEFSWTNADTVLVYKLFVFHSSRILG